MHISIHPTILCYGCVLLCCFLRHSIHHFFMGRLSNCLSCTALSNQKLPNFWRCAPAASRFDLSDLSAVSLGGHVPTAPLFPIHTAPAAYGFMRMCKSCHIESIG